MDQMRVCLGAGRQKQKNGCVSHLASPPRLSAGLIPTLTKQIANNFNYLCIQSLSPSTTPHFACANEKKKRDRRKRSIITYFTGVRQNAFCQMTLIPNG